MKWRRRTIQWVWNGLAAASLLLSLALVAEWVRSHQIRDGVVCRIHGPVPPYGRALWAEVSLEEGRLNIDEVEHQPDNTSESWRVGDIRGSDGPSPAWRSAPATRQFSPQPRSIWNRLGFSHGTYRLAISPFLSNPYIFDHREWSVPIWMTFCVIELPASLWFLAAWKRYRRKQRGGCPVCGYDLRATPDRCPECGTVPVVARASRPC